MGWRAGIGSATLVLVCCSSDATSTPEAPSTTASELALACAKWVSCAESPKPASVGRCMLDSERTTGVAFSINEAETLTTPRSCILQAKTCAEARACASGESGTCSVEGAHCEGSRVIACGLGKQSVHDCAVSNSSRLDSGASCIELKAGHACAFGTCNDEAPRCEGNVLVSCDHGALSKRTCKSGTHCADGACHGDGPACGAHQRCDGTDEISCFAGQEARVACAAGEVATACDPRFGCAQPANAPCSVDTFTDHCDGANLVVCAGRITNIDCRALGFGGCAGTTCVP